MTRITAVIVEKTTVACHRQLEHGRAEGLAALARPSKTEEVPPNRGNLRLSPFPRPSLARGLQTAGEAEGILGQAPKRTPVTPIKQLNPFNLPTGPIPKAHIATAPGPAKGQKRHPLFYAEILPLPATRKIKGAAVPWCSFLKLGGISNHTTEAEYRMLLQHFGSEKALQRQAAPVPAVGRAAKSAASSRTTEAGHIGAKRNFDAEDDLWLAKPENGKIHYKIGEDLDPEPAHMHAGDKAADLRSRREGTILILENRATAVVSWSAFAPASLPS